MRKLLILIIMTLSLVRLSGQEKVKLDDCYQWARDNYPNLKQTGLLEKISQLNQANIRTSMLPSLNLNGQATYQSDVTKVEIPIPGIKIPEIAKDQFKIYLEARQTIWDGGMVKTQEKLEAASLKVGLSQLEAELYQLREQVNEVFFMALILQKQQEIIDKQASTLKEKLKMVVSAVNNGMSEISNKWALEAEILQVAQQKEKATAGTEAALSVLSLLTGKEIPDASRLVFDKVTLPGELTMNRPELEIFTNRRDQLSLRSDLTGKQRLPKFFGFGQMGYGRPGLNMLNSKSDSYYIFGVGLSWNIWDFRKAQREKEGIIYQQEVISAQEATFRKNLTLILTRQKSTIDEISSAIEKDLQITELRKSISDATSAKLNNGTITAADYIRDLNAETIARLNLETRTLQLEEAKIRYRTISGN